MTYTLEQFEAVMDRSGEPRARVALEVGVSRKTVDRWQSGQSCPMCVPPSWWLDNGYFHARHNPDPDVILVSSLWYRADDVLALIDGRIGRETAMRVLMARRNEPAFSGAQRIFQRIRNDGRTWYKFLAVENLMSCLGLSTTDLPEPTRRSHLEAA